MKFKVVLHEDGTAVDIDAAFAEEKLGTMTLYRWQLEGEGKALSARGIAAFASGTWRRVIPTE